MPILLDGLKLNFVMKCGYLRRGQLRSIKGLIDICSLKFKRTWCVCVCVLFGRGNGGRERERERAGNW
jgi:hypothetical protein